MVPGAISRYLSRITGEISPFRGAISSIMREPISSRSLQRGMFAREIIRVDRKNPSQETVPSQLSKSPSRCYRDVPREVPSANEYKLNLNYCSLEMSSR